jgi:hypothetical protein
MIKKTFKRTGLLAFLAVVTFGFGCNIADKKSSLKKDSVGNDTEVNDVVGGVETFETNMEEDAADYLKAAGTLLVIQDSILTVAVSAPGKSRAKIYAEQAQKRIRTQKKALEKFCNANRVLLMEDLRTELLDSLHRLSRQKGAAFDSQFHSWLSTKFQRSLYAYEQAGHARQQRVKNFVNKALPIARKEVELLKQAGF